MKLPSPSSAARTRVLFLLPNLQGGGAERVILTVVRHLDRGWFEPIVAVVDSRDPVYRAEFPADVELIDLKARRVRHAAPAILRLIWKRRPRVVLSTIGHLNIAVAMIRSLLPRDVRLIARETAVVTAMFEYRRWPALWAGIYRWMYNRFDVVLCQSNDMQRALVEKLGVPPTRTTVIHNPVDLDHLHTLKDAAVPNEDEWAVEDREIIRLVAVGRLDHQKGFDLLIEALALCDNPRLRLWILGKGPLRNNLEAQAVRLGVAPRIKFLGFRANPYPFLRSAHALVLSSRFEGLPNVMLEALACGTPVIATPAKGGVLEVLDNRPGCAVASEISAEGLASVIRAYPFQDRFALEPSTLHEFSAAHIGSQYEALLSKRGAAGS